MTKNPFLAQDRLILGDIYTSNRAADNLATLCDTFGSRFGGTEGERLAATFLRDELRSYGLANARLEPFTYVGWRRGTAALAVTAPIAQSMACITLPHSPPAAIEAPIIDLGDGAPADFERRQDDIAGKIVLTNSKISPPGVGRWIHRSEKYGRSLLAGAAGFIFVNHYPGYGPATGSVGHKGEALIPAFSVSYEDGARLQRLLKQHDEVVVRLSSDDACEPMTSWNVVADLPGHGDAPEIVMLGCHYDGHDISQGAADPASGAVAVVEAARALAAHAPDLPHTVRFALWGVEEIGLLGSYTYVDAHADELDRVRFYLNMDSAGAKTGRGIVLNEWPALRPLLARYGDEMAHNFPIGQSVHAFSDHYPFLLAGVPTGGMETVERDMSGRGYGHTHHDTVDKVPVAALREAAALAARLALRIASETTWPARRRDQAAVDALFEKPAYQEDAAIRAAIEAFYERARAGAA